MLTGGQPVLPSFNCIVSLRLLLLVVAAEQQPENLAQDPKDANLVERGVELGARAHHLLGARRRHRPGDVQHAGAVLVHATRSRARLKA